MHYLRNSLRLTSSNLRFFPRINPDLRVLLRFENLRTRATTPVRPVGRGLSANEIAGNSDQPTSGAKMTTSPELENTPLRYRSAPANIPRPTLADSTSCCSTRESGPQ